MKKIRYYYNTNTLRYEKQVVPLRETLLRILAFLSAAIVTAMIIVTIAFKFLDSPKEKLLKIQLERTQEQNKVYSELVDDINDRLKQLEKVAGMDQSELTEQVFKTLNTLYNRVVNQENSFKEIEGMIRNKEKLLASTPAIQPISNKDLNRLSSGFSYRIDPIYKTVKFHPGLDFSAPQGTPIYATAQGVVRTAGNLGNGYGNHVIINHGYQYSTLYGHMYRIKVRVGQSVKRGEVIGYVGNSGKSTGSHLHYEVMKGKKHLDPIYFFYNDLTPEQYQQILKIASSRNQSFD